MKWLLTLFSSTATSISNRLDPLNSSECKWKCASWCGPTRKCKSPLSSIAQIGELYTARLPPEKLVNTPLPPAAIDTVSELPFTPIISPVAPIYPAIDESWCN